MIAIASARVAIPIPIAAQRSTLLEELCLVLAA
jgi:hypothetical protein